ncbi:MAG: restriction endonuclease subunit S [Candidatus Marinimicrobia bacterium]|nr:restriction endonuclease subunit S [Candidatus Neomarinimicrobiota bacterium]MBT4359919.1 restriction endonuclease subunit S [Candidatus Neomarinimicrobiota bacterium]MBT5268196.1 restriction endonuclease subunit S [Candidatus Neomarinimicrobiota bacterium]
MGNKPWDISSISDLIEDGVITAHKDGNHGSNYPRVHEFGEKGVPFLTAKLLDEGGRIELQSAKRLNFEKAKKITFGYIEEGDVLLSHNATVGRVAVVPELTEKVLIGTSLTHYRLDSTRLLPGYLAAYFRGRDFQNQLAAVMSLSTRNQVPITLQRKLNVVVPPISEQKSIAHILGTLDDKIELNRRMNETLEGMAQALFKRWFVDFDPVLDKAMDAGNPIPEPFQKRAAARKQLGNKRKLLPAHIAKHFPDSFVFDEEMGWIPEEWEKKQVKDFGSIICGKTPSKSIKNYYGDAIPFIKIPDMHNSVWITNTSDGLSLVGARSQAKKQIPENSICVSCIATIGKVVITSEDSHTNQQINSVVPHRKAFKYFLYFAFLNMNKFLHDMASGGSATLNLNTGNFSKIEILSPSYSVANAYYNSVDPLFQKMLANDVESKSLTNLRDALLPKLLSGELRVPDVEKLIEKAL